jgi:large subunit ribosomal protein L30
MAKTSRSNKTKATGTVTVVQIHSEIGCPERQRRTLRSLGLRRIRQRRQLPDLPSVRGMVKAIPHLVRIEERPATRRGGSRT